MTVYATRALVETCCRLAADADPEPVSVSLVGEPARELDDDDAAGVSLADLDPETEVLAEFYFPGAGEALSNVFGMDLATPAGTDGRFLSHPDGFSEVSVSDDLHVRILVATPPYEPERVRAFDRNGSELELELVAARSKDREFDA